MWTQISRLLNPTYSKLDKLTGYDTDALKDMTGYETDGPTFIMGGNGN